MVVIAGAASCPPVEAQTRTTVRVSAKEPPNRTGGTESFSGDASSSSDGRYIAFLSASQLLAEDTDDVVDVYLRDRVTGTLTRLGPGGLPSVSGDGRYIAFAQSRASPLGYFDEREIRLYDIGAKTVRVLPMKIPLPPGTVTNYSVFHPELSYDGRYLALMVESVLPGYIFRRDTYRHDIATTVTVRVSVRTGGQDVIGLAGCDASVQETFCGSNGKATISDDGRFVAFYSNYPFVPDDTNAKSDLYIHDVTTRTTTLISVGAGGGAANAETGGPSYANFYKPSISGDGRFVLFDSVATNIAGAPSNGLRQVYLADRAAGTVLLVTRSADGVAANASGRSGALANSGLYLTFSSGATNLRGAEILNGLPPGYQHAYVGEFDPAKATVERLAKASVASDGTPNAGAVPEGGEAADISDDGRLIVFTSAANLAPNDTNNTADVFLHDRTAFFLNTTRTGQTTGALDMEQPAVSANNRFVAFASSNASLVVGDTNGVADVFVRDRLTGRVVRVSVASTGQPGNGESRAPKISADGRWVVFTSLATNLDPDDRNGVADIFLHDRDADQNGWFDETGKTRTRPVSLGLKGTEANGPSTEPAMSGDALSIVFTSMASNLVVNDRNGVSDIFLFDVRLAQTTRVSINTMSGGTEANGASTQPSISTNGDYIAFASLASNLIDNVDPYGPSGPCQRLIWENFPSCSIPDRNGVMDVYYHRRRGSLGCYMGCTYEPQPGASGLTGRASVGWGDSVFGREGNGPSYQPSIDDLGWVLFATEATNLPLIGPGAGPDPNGTLSDVLLRIPEASYTFAVARGNGASSHPVFAPVGSERFSKFAVFASTASNLVFADLNGLEDVFRVDVGALPVQPYQITRVSVVGAREGDGRSYDPAAGEDGKVVAFTTESRTLIPGADAGEPPDGPMTWGRGGMITAGDGDNSTEVVYQGTTPEVTELSPDHGSTGGGDSLVLTGKNLDAQWLAYKSLRLGDAAATNLTLVTESTLSARSGPSASAGTVDAEIYDSVGAAATLLSTRFRYEQVVNVGSSCADNTYVLGATEVTVGADAKHVTVDVQAQPGCHWTASPDSNTPWLSVVAIEGGSVASIGNTLTGVGTHKLEFQVTANQSGAPRSGHIFVHTKVLTVTQNDAPPLQEVCGNGADDDRDGQIDEACPGCEFAVGPPVYPVPSQGGTGAVAITANFPACYWTAESADPSVAAISGAPFGTGNGAVNFSVVANPFGAPRSVALAVAGKTVMVTQAAACFYTLSTTALSVGPRGGTVTVGVTATAPECEWKAIPAASFVTAATGDYAGSGTASIQVGDNHTGLRRETTVMVAGQTVTLIQRGRIVTGDFDGDGSTELTVFRPSDGVWYQRSPLTGLVRGVQWGNSADIPTPGDYDGDGITDVAVFRPGDGTWQLRYSGQPLNSFQWGNGADAPVPGDYDGDGITDLAVFRPATGTWFITYMGTRTTAGFQWGNAVDIPVPGDYDGDGKSDIAVFRPAIGVWFVRYSATGTTAGFQWGNGADIPVPGDYDADGFTDMAVYRPAAGVWFVRYSATGSTAGFQWGNAADFPVPGDFDADGRTDIAVWRPGDGVWYLWYSRGGTAGYQWGNGADVPIMKQR